MSLWGLLTTILLSAVMGGMSAYFFCKHYLFHQKLRRIRHRLLVTEKREERFRKLVEHSGDLITIHNVDGVYQYVSPASTRLIGYSMSELLGKKVFEYIHQDDLKQMQINLIKLLKAENVQMTFRIKARDGSYVWFETSLTAVTDRQGKLQEVIAVSRNITQRKLDELALKKSNERLEYLSITDTVTGIANRRYFEEYLAKEWRKAIAASTPISLLFVDIDCFKNYNDTYGHQEGDQALQLVAERLRQSVQISPHLVARYGGEEFIVVFPNADTETALQKAEKLRTEVEALQILHETSSVSPVLTVSIGVSTIQAPNACDNTDLLIAKADRALYEAKEAGRNRVKFNR